MRTVALSAPHLRLRASQVASPPCTCVTQMEGFVCRLAAQNGQRRHTYPPFLSSQVSDYWIPYI